MLVLRWVQNTWRYLYVTMAAGILTKKKRSGSSLPLIAFACKLLPNFKVYCLALFSMLVNFEYGLVIYTYPWLQNSKFGPLWPQLIVMISVSFVHFWAPNIALSNLKQNEQVWKELKWAQKRYPGKESKGLQNNLDASVHIAHITKSSTCCSWLIFGSMSTFHSLSYQMRSLPLQETKLSCQTVP